MSGVSNAQPIKIADLNRLLANGDLRLLSSHATSTSGIFVAVQDLVKKTVRGRTISIPGSLHVYVIDDLTSAPITVTGTPPVNVQGTGASSAVQAVLLASFFDAGASAIFAEAPTPLFGTLGTTPSAETQVSLPSSSGGFLRVISTANTSQVTRIDTRNRAKTLSIYSTAASGTFTLSVSIGDSAAFTNSINIDSLAAANPQVKVYTETTLGATIAVSPLSYRWISITIGAAGVGVTTETWIGIK